MNASVAALVLLAACAVPPHGEAQEVQPPTLAAGVLPEDLAIDGVLNEPAWETASIADAFTQADPSEGEAPAGRTLVRVLAGPKTLVIGIVCEARPGRDRHVQRQA